MSAHEHDDDQPDSFEVIERLRARVAQLEEALKECADDLEAEFRHKYRLNDGTIHPAQQRDFDRDMDVVVRARAALKDQP